MIQNLSKVEYNRVKKIPQLTPIIKLEPQQPARDHLLDCLPRITSEVDKILSNRHEENRFALELANAHKIIHELEL